MRVYRFRHFGTRQQEGSLTHPWSPLRKTCCSYNRDMSDDTTTGGPRGASGSDTGAGSGSRGRVALVTGGASGIGLACAEGLLADGLQVAITDLAGSQGQHLA